MQIGHPADLSLHAGVATKANEWAKLERLCRYVSRPAISEKRLSLTEGGNMRYQLKTPYRDGTTHVMLLRASCPPPLRASLWLFKIAPGDFVQPLDFIARLAALVPKPKVYLTRFHWLFAPNSKHRAWVTPAKRGKGNQAKTPKEVEDPTPAERRAAMTWPQRLKRVSDVDITICRECGGAVKAIAGIENPVVIEKIVHLDEKAAPAETDLLPEGRAPPHPSWLD